LRLIAFLDPDAISELLIVQCAEMLGAVLAPVVANPLKLNEALQVLRRYSLIRRDPVTKLLTVHQLVQEVLRDRMDRETRLQWAQRAACIAKVAISEAKY
jgi:hypothetical protein